MACSSVSADELIHDFKKYNKIKKKITLNEIIKGLNYPWGMTFIDKENLIITEKNGGLLKINVITKKITKIKHKIKSIPFNGSEQGGFLDVLYNDGYLYFSYSHVFDSRNNKTFSSTAIARGKLVDNQINDLEILIIGKPKYTRNIHWGSRIVIHKNHLYASFGERGMGMIAQDPSTLPGSIVRINIDGSIPIDNPSNIDRPEWLPEIYQIGVRNPQGMAISPRNNDIYFSQHGPRGGDNIGIVKKEEIMDGNTLHGEEQNILVVKLVLNHFKKIRLSCNFLGSVNWNWANKLYSGKTFNEWDGNMIVSAAKAGLLFRLILEKNRVVGQEIIIEQEIGRIRDFEISADGDIYLIVDDENSSLWKLSK